MSFGTNNQIWHCGQVMRKRRILNCELCKINQNIQSSEESEDISPLFGKRDAICENAEKEHAELFAKQLEVFRVINNVDESEYLDIEIPYLEGYLAGIRFLIQTDRSIFKMDIPFTLVVYSKSLDILSNYELALCCLPNIKKVGDGAQKQYLVTDNISDILSLSFSEDEEVAVFIIYEKGNAKAYLDDFPVLSEFCKGNLFYSCEDVGSNFEIKTPVSQVNKLLRKTII